MMLVFKRSAPPSWRRFATALAAAVLFCTGSLQAADNGLRNHAGGTFDAATGRYEVAKGDDLAGIGARFGVSVADIKEANKLDSDMIAIGQELVVTTGAPATEGAATDAPQASTQVSPPVASQVTPQITGVLGSPGATTTIPGNQLPAPQPAFGGVIKDDALQSKQWWAPRIVPPKGAPDILLILTDDAGFGVPSTFGGVIPTPSMDRIAENGLRYNRIFSTSLCSPTRAALITGRNHHSVGFGVIAEQATGFPGYNSVIGADNATIGRILRDNGYATSWFGKNHNTPTYEASQAGPFNQWPTGMGFDYFYGFVGGDANQWGPEPVPQHHADLSLDRSRGHPEDGSVRSEGGDLASHRSREFLEPDHRDGRRRHRLDGPDSPDRPHAADLPPLLPRLLARAAPPDQGMGGQDQRDASLRRRLREAARADLRESKETRRHSAGSGTDSLAEGHPDALGRALGRCEEALYPPGRGVCRLCRLQRP